MIPTTFLIEIGRQSKSVIGRFNPDTNYTPDISLDCVNAEHYGVSRRHAVLLWRNEILYIMDLDSTNGTWVNGTRLFAQQPHRLNDGDELQLGRLQLHLRFDPAGKTPPAFVTTVPI
jgi:pSer/pThr/pTyr-binding forkhead associated (FHA) protein